MGLSCSADAISAAAGHITRTTWRQVARIVMASGKQNEMSLKDKRQLVYEISRWPQSAVEILQCWTRRELLEVICAELGKERKYTNVPKSKMIAYLLKLVSRKNGQLKHDSANAILSAQSNKDDTQPKGSGEKQNLMKPVNSDSSTHKEARAGSSRVCKNVACQAALNAGDAYCKRCSCCICHRYDENKDPSLWLFCTSDVPYSGFSCGMSCHLNCALKSKKAGILKNGCSNKIEDFTFYCVYCGKLNWLMRSLRKQLAIAIEARRVDVLCERLSLSNKIVKGSENFMELVNIISSAVKILEKEVGSALDKVSATWGRGIVNRLTCRADVQELCSRALEIVDSAVHDTMQFESNDNPKLIDLQPQILFEEITPSSVVIMLKYQDNMAMAHIDGCKVWHRSAKVHQYPLEPTCQILRPNTRSCFSGLSPSTEYIFKVVPFGSTQEFGECEARCATRNLDRGSSQCSTQNSESMCLRVDSIQHQQKNFNKLNLHEVIQYDSPKGSTHSSENNVSSEQCSKRAKVARVDGASDNDESQVPPTSEVLPSSNSSPVGAPSKPVLLSSTPDSASKNYLEQQYDYCVKVIRWLESEGHMKSDFRVAFLTWFSLKATAQDRRIVSAFVDALIGDPASLVEQLTDAFMDIVCIKEKPPQPKRKGACCKHWH